ncbi:AAA family ATPase [Streptomyces sp. HPF1205]|jgi:nicotinamide riboside kinase|uniref:AAA family ATPase n=1 Tax=Streptomyces sp. HPF1205 TaxID=2873262 RepID=UPI001CEC0356|nr:AAA family ATPase [Streptomyces sp. HPF1205]
MQEVLRLAVSGTYSTGKSTTTEALSLLTGVPRTHAMTARQILMELVPGKQLSELNASELQAMGLRRFEERVHNEAAQPGSFISDGSVLHEWVYSEARLRVGTNPGAGPLHRATKAVVGAPLKPFYQGFADSYGKVVKARAKRVYDAYVHLPVEFAMHRDGHRPVSERFRNTSDRLLLETLDELEIPYHVIGGSLRERLEKIVAAFDMPVVRPIDEAIEIAEARVRETIAVIEADQRYHDAQRRKSTWRRIKYALRY